jgi:hypothetical protein
LQARRNALYFASKTKAMLCLGPAHPINASLGAAEAAEPLRLRLGPKYQTETFAISAGKTRIAYHLPELPAGGLTVVGRPPFALVESRRDADQCCCFPAATWTDTGETCIQTRDVCAPGPCHTVGFCMKILASSRGMSAASSVFNRLTFPLTRVAAPEF